MEESKLIFEYYIPLDLIKKVTKKIKCYTCFWGFSLESRLCVLVVPGVRVKYGIGDGRIVWIFLKWKECKEKDEENIAKKWFSYVFL